MFRKPKILLILILIFIILFLSLPIQISRNIKAKLTDISYPLLSATGFVSQKLYSFESSIREVFSAVRDNRRLKDELAELSLQVIQLKEAKLENQRLKKLLDLKASLPQKSIACKVIGRDASSWFRSLIIDNGTEAGIKPDMPVISVDGVIGRIISSGRNTATILLITDTNSSIGGMIQDTRVVGLVSGQGTDESIFNYIPKKAVVQIRDIIVTSGLGTIFPKGLIIGKITDVVMDSQGLYQIASIELAADVDRVEEVLVILK